GCDALPRGRRQTRRHLTARRLRRPRAGGMLRFMSDVTRLLDAAAAGDRRAAADLLPLVYDELRTLAAARMSTEAPGQTLGAPATAPRRAPLVHRRLPALPGGPHVGGPRPFPRPPRGALAPPPGGRRPPQGRRASRRRQGPRAARGRPPHPGVPRRAPRPR